MRSVALLFIFFLIAAPLKAQREAANWYFGAKAGLDFNSGEPVPLLDGELDTLEGCESFSTADGSLLFYTDGQTVWTRNHQIMPNGEGLLGSFSSTQSALVIPKPGSGSIYYIFTADDVRSYQTNDGNGDGLNYSVVDMSLNGGLGDVTQKNRPLLPNGSEKITAVGRGDGESYWVVTHYRDRFYSFRVDQNGVNTNAVESILGPNISDFNNIRGAIKSSPKGDRIAIAHTIFEPDFAGQLRMYDFNRETGRLSNEVLLDDSLVYYGVEFSSNSKKLFASGKEIDPTTGETTDIQIVQFDLEATDVPGTFFVQADFENTFQSDLAGSLQIAINRKVYHSMPGFSLSVINSPNNYGLDADFRAFTVDLGGRNTKFGLPPFIQSFFESAVRAEQFCFGSPTEFFIETSEPIAAISWDFGDPTSGANNTSTELEPTHLFTAPGLYTVTTDIDFQNGVSRTFIEFIDIAPVPDVNPNVVLVQCDVDGVDDGISRFNLNEAIRDLVGNPLGFTANFFETLEDANANQNNLEPIGYQNRFNGQQIYARVFKDALCFQIATVQLEVEPMSMAEDITLPACNISPGPLVTIVRVDELIVPLQLAYPGQDISIFITLEDALLETNQAVDEIRIGLFDPAEVYYRVENSNDCAFIGRVDLEIFQAPLIDDQEVVLCPNETSVTITPGDGFLEYQWSTGETTPSIDVDEPGEYEVTVVNGSDCSDAALITVTRPPLPQGLEVVVVDFSNDNSITVQLNEAEAYQYSLDDGPLQDSNVFSDLATGPYTVLVWRDGCLIYQETVIVGGPPNYFTPNNDGFNDTWSVIGGPELSDARIYIFDRYGKLLKQLFANGEGWDGTFLGEPMPSSDYWYRIELSDGRLVNGNFSLKR
jgi:gliding motility-associated-like protein